MIKVCQKADSFCVSSGIPFNFSPLWASEHAYHKVHTLLQDRSKKLKDTPSRFFEIHLFCLLQTLLRRQKAEFIKIRKGQGVYFINDSAGLCELVRVIRSLSVKIYTLLLLMMLYMSRRIVSLSYTFYICFSLLTIALTELLYCDGDIPVNFLNCLEK